MPHVVIAGAIHPDGLRLIGSAPGYTHAYQPDMGPDAYARLMPGADALVVRTQPVTASVLEMAPRLRLVSRHGVGVDSVDRAALAARGIPLMVTGEVGALSVAEHAFAALMALVKRLPQADAAMRSGNWDWKHRREGREMAGRRLLLIGYGRIARLVAGMAAAFGTQVRAFSPGIPEAAWPEGPALRAPDLIEALAWAELVSVHSPWRGAPVLGAAELEQLRPGALIVNTARGGVVDEAALAAALVSGHVAGAALDVFREEPPPATSPLFAAPNLLLSPHVAGITEDSAARMAVVSVQNVLDHFAGRADPALVVPFSG